MRLLPLRQLSTSPLFLSGVACGTALISGLIVLATNQILKPGPLKPATRAAESETRAFATAGYGHLPLLFEKNLGQTAPAVQYLARGAGYSLFLAGDEAVLSLQAHIPTATAPHSKGSDGLQRLPDSSDAAQIRTVSIVRAQLVGANPATQPQAEDALPGHSNYLTGSSVASWHSDVAQYARLRYHDIYDGIDLVYYGNQGQLEYDFVVAPGASTDRIRLRYRGIDSASIDAGGDLHLHNAGGELVEHKPRIYQTRDGRLDTVDGRFRIVHDQQAIEVAFEVGDYDRARPLIIDPVLSYAGFLGGSSNEQGLSIAVDSSGAAYVTGFTPSADFPTTSGASQTGYAGNTDAFVSKISADGSTLVYSTYLGGGQSDAAYGLAVDSGGQAYVVGYTSSADFPTTAGAFQTSLLGSQNAFVSKLSADGGSLVYSTYLGGTAIEQARSVAVDNTGAAYITGYTSSTDFPTTAGAFQAALTGTADAFASKLSADGGHLVYSTYLGGTSSQQAFGIAIDGAGAAYVIGETTSSDFPTTSGAYQTSLGGSTDAFISKISANGHSLVYSTYLGGAGSEVGLGIALDSHGSAYVTGYTLAGGFPTTPNSFQPTANNNQHGFVTKFSADGSSLVYSSYLGGTLAQISQSIGVDSTGAAYVTGPTNSVDFPAIGTQFQSAPAAAIFSFVCKFSVDGSSLTYSALLGGSTLDWTYGIAVSPGGSAYVTGYTESSDFPATSAAFGTSLGGAMDALVAKITEITLSPATVDFGYVPAATPSAATTLTLSNDSDDDVTIDSIAASNPAFAAASHCGTTVAAGASCTIDVRMTPATFGAVSGTLTITTSEAVLTASLSGIGVAVPVASASLASLDLGTSVNGNPTSASVVLTDIGPAPLAITAITTSVGFSQTSNCGSNLAPGAQCTITVIFQPTQLGVSNGSLTIASNSALGAVRVNLTGKNVYYPTASSGSSSGGGAIGGDVLVLLAAMAGLRRRFAQRAGSMLR